MKSIERVNVDIKAKRVWSVMSVLQTCVNNELYTLGDCEEYDQMFSVVENTEPTIENLFLVAQNIQQHSEDQTITNVMFLLERDAVTTTFEIDGMDDI